LALAGESVSVGFIATTNLVSKGSKT
jgi:hypothetical protein